MFLNTCMAQIPLITRYEMFGTECVGDRIREPSND